MMRKSTRMLSLFLCVVLLISLMPMSVFAAKTVGPFEDVKSDAWYADAVQYVYDNGLMNGMSKTTFEPQTTTSRAMIVTILYRLAGEPAVSGKSTFEDVAAGKWYTDAINWAAKEGVVSGYSAKKFGPNDVITREQIATILCRYADQQGVDVSKRDDLKAFSDKGAVSSWAKDAMQWAVAVGLINGRTADTLVPKGNTTRAEAATLLMRFVEKILPKPEESAAPVVTPAATETPKPTESPKPTETPKPTESPKPTPADSEDDADDTDDSEGPFVVSFDSNGGSAAEDQTVNAGEYATKPDIDPRDGYQFAGWFLDEDETDLTNCFVFGTTPITENITLHAIWVDVSSDKDSDGFADELEDYVGTDKSKNDTDGDGLTDYQEVVEVGTDPLKPDTDGDGISDFDEDYDGDSVSNGLEFQYGTSPILADSDHDDLKDSEELKTYKTDPNAADSDGDGAKDGWEVRNGYDPLAYNDSFTVRVDADQPGDTNPITAGVAAVTDGGNAASVDVQPASSVDNALISPSIAGYLGQAYSFTADEAIQSATLTFLYDESVGVLGPDFQPRIYYLNEDTGELEELPNQTVENGKVTATVSHFSTYILLNKVAFDKVWEEDIKAPIVDSTGKATNIDVVFVIDVSGSMRSYNRMTTAKAAMNTFLDALNDNDRAALVKFNGSATVVAGLTSDKEALKNSVDSLYPDGMTSMYNGLDDAISMLNDPDAVYGYKMIVVLSDGRDEPSTNYSSYYADRVTRANDSNIVIYTVGAGSNTDTSILRQVAQNTGGAYYEATVTSGITDAFEEIQADTVDLTADANGDGIPDYFNDKLAQGKMVLSNGSDEFAFIDFNYDENGNPSADYDGDGLKNGEELQIVQNGNRVYMVMKSNPVLKDSDGDGVSDANEKANGTDPLVYQTSKTALDNLMNDRLYYYEVKVEDNADNWLLNADRAFLAAIYGIWNKDELYRNNMIDYFSNYGEATFNEDLEASHLKKGMIESLMDIISKIKKNVKDPADEIKDIYKLISKIKGTYDEDAVLYLVYHSYTETIEHVTTIYPDLGITVSTYSMKIEVVDRIVNVSKIADIVGKVAKGIKYTVKVGKTIIPYAKVGANEEAFERNIEILQEIAKYSSDKHAVNAAYDIMDRMAGGYSSAVQSCIQDAAEIAIDLAWDKLAAANIYVFIFEVVRVGLDLITGISDDLEQEFEMMSFERMATAVNRLLFTKGYGSGNAYYVKDSNLPGFKQLVSNLAQIRILGEKKYCDFMEYGGMLGWFIDNSENEALVDDQITWVSGLVDTLGVTISSDLKK